MKKYLSVIMLFARSTIIRIIGIFAIMVVAESGFFFIAMKQNRYLEDTFTLSRIQWIFAIMFILLSATLVTVG